MPLQRDQDPATSDPLGECSAPSAAGDTSGMNRDNPRSSIDWLGMPASFARAGLDVTRVIPLVGMFTGMTADVIEGAQNLATAGDTGNQWMELGVMLRQGIVFMNNVIGHVLYVGELCQDAAIVSVVGIELEVVIAPGDEALAMFKLVLQSLQTVADIAILAGAVVGAENSVVGSEEWEAHKSLASGFVVDAGLDVAGLLMDIGDTCTAGLMNGQVVKEATRSVFGLKAFGQAFLDNLDDIIQAWISIFGGDGISAIIDLGQQKSDGATTADAASIMIGELAEIQQVHSFGDGAITAATTQVETMLADLRTLQEEALGGKEPFIAMRDAMLDGLAQFEGRLIALQEADSLATSAESEVASILANLDAAEAAVDQLRLPEIKLPEHTELGDNPLADGIEGVVDTGAGVANEAIAAATQKLQAAIDAVKGAVVSEIHPQRAEIEAFAQFITTFKQLVAEQLALVTDAVTKLREHAAAADNPEELIDALLAQVAEMLGMEGELSVDELRQQWVAAGARISELMTWARGLAAG